jgi:phosphoenolpyruvate carboxylase
VIQENNGELGANRYIISNNESAPKCNGDFCNDLNDWESLTLFPLFESVDDLLNAHTIMEQLYTNQSIT